VTNLFGLYRDRQTPLHLLPAPVKMLGLIASGVWLAWNTRPEWAVASLGVAALLLASALPPPRATVRGVAPIVVVAAITAAYQAWLGQAALAVDLAADLLSLVCLSLAVTTSTPLDEAMDLVSTLARPIRRWISSEALSLLFSLSIRTIPEVTRILAESRDAARSRGLDRSPRAMLVPAGVRTVGYALAVGDAITARGLADEATGPRRSRPRRESPATA
jgi:biotin transport system permease protein